MFTTGIILVFALMLLSLAAGLFFLFKDQGNQRRLLTSLKFRIALGVLLCVLITTGLLTGELTVKAPWSQSHYVDENKQP